MGRSVGVGRGGVRVVRFFLAGEEDAAVWGLELGSWVPAASSGPTTRTSWAKKRSQNGLKRRIGTEGQREAKLKGLQNASVS